ncbi:MAG TPA: BTAD domain-containing putative transcriptional regulator [Candidatus Dormibacteraeota bacterium]|nr:BTAD domain-containing putative transcriptional regulator [Candidatus Dormibacteraeota bacterium]
MLRIYLAGEIQVESALGLIRESDLPARQGRLAFAHLVDRRAHPVSREELAEVLWAGSLPGAWAVSLSAILSKLRVVLEAAGLPREEVITTAFGCYQLHLPKDAWVDLEVAASALHAAEAAIAAGEPARAHGDALVALTILRRPFLPGGQGQWVEARQEALRAQLLRALDCMVHCLAANGEIELAVRNAEELVAMEPFREGGYRHLMRLHTARGDRAEALRVYESCRARLVNELGVGPSAETEALQVSLLKLA